MRGDESENEDDPELYMSSGDEWNVETENYKNRRKSSRLLPNTKSGVIKLYEDDDDDDDDKDEKVINCIEKNKKRGPGRPRKRVSNDTPNNSKKLKRNESKNDNVIKGLKKFVPRTIKCVEYTNGSFVLLRKDLLLNDSRELLNIWRIDGKALLQKFQPYKKENKTYHHSTPIFAGWSPIEQDLYLPLTVDLVGHEEKKLIVSVHWDQVIKDTDVDSD